MAFTPSSEALIKTIETHLMPAFKKFNLPAQRVFPLESISEIIDLVNFVRQQKYGPQIQIGTDKITIQYIAAFTGPKGQYTEQLFVHIKDKDYEKINQLFTQCKLDILKEDQKSKILISECDEKNKWAYAKLKQYEDLLGQKLNEPFEDMDELSFREYYATIEKSLVEEMDHIYTSAGKDIANILGEMMPTITKKVLQLRNSIVSVWLVAESFRYPPMIFYSLLTLHNFLYNYKPTDTSSSPPSHPSTTYRSHLGQWLCFERACDYPSEESAENTKLVEELKKRIFEVVKTLYDNYCCGFESSPQKEFFYELKLDGFRNLLRRYLKLTGVDEQKANQEKFDDLIKELERHRNTRTRLA